MTNHSFPSPMHFNLLHINKNLCSSATVSVSLHQGCQMGERPEPNGLLCFCVRCYMTEAWICTLHQSSCQCGMFSYPMILLPWVFRFPKHDCCCYLPVTDKKKIGRSHRSCVFLINKKILPLSTRTKDRVGKKCLKTS